MSHFAFAVCNHNRLQPPHRDRIRGQCCAVADADVLRAVRSFAPDDWKHDYGVSVISVAALVSSMDT